MLDEDEGAALADEAGGLVPLEQQAVHAVGNGAIERVIVAQLKQQGRLGQRRARQPALPFGPVLTAENQQIQARIQELNELFSQLATEATETHAEALLTGLAGQQLQLSQGRSATQLQVQNPGAAGTGSGYRQGGVIKTKGRQQQLAKTSALHGT